MAVAGVLSLVVDRGRVWLLPDSVTYLGVAHNVAHGLGVTSPFPNARDPFAATVTGRGPLVIWPPGYPVLLAALMVTGRTAATAAQVWSTVATVATVGLLAEFTWRTTGRRGLAVMSGGLVAVSTVLAQNARFALSDVLFTALVAGFLLAAAAATAAVGRGSAVLWMLPPLVVAAAMVRWIGLVLVVPAAVAAAAGRPRSEARRAAAWQLLVPPVAVAAYVLSGSVPPRTVAWHDVLDPLGALRTVGTWFSPAAGSRGLDLVLGSAAAAVVVATAAATLLRPAPRHRSLIVATLGSLVVGLVVNGLLFDASTPWDDRLLLPVAVLVVVLAVDLVADRSVPVRRAAVAVLALFAVAQLCAWPSLLSASGSPLGFTGRSWTGMPMAAIDARLDRYRVVATNRPEVVYLWTHRPSLAVPERFSPITLEPNRQLGVQLRQLAGSLAGDGAVVFYDDPTNPRPYLATEAQVVRTAGLRLVASFPGARIYAR